MRRRRRLSTTWAVVVVLWALIRAAVVWATLGDYEINPWIYLGIDLASAIVDGYTTPKAVLAFIDEKYTDAAKWVAISAIAFIIPDLYLVLGGKRLPTAAFVIIGAVVLITGSLSVYGIRKKIKAGREARAAGAEPEPDTISR